MARTRRKEKNGPGLLFILVTLVVVAVVGARFFGFYPDDGGRSTPPQEDPSPPTSEAPPPVPDTPAVLVFHSHATENYSPKQSHQRGGEPGDVVEVGRELVQALQQQGIGVLHDITVHDKPRYSEAFVNSARMVEQALADNSDLQMILDVHRDGLQDRPDGFTRVQVRGEDVAKILFVVGDQDNTRVEENVAFAEQISDALEARYPGVTRGVRVFKSNYSGQLHPNSVMVIIGDWKGNSIDEAKRSARLLAEVVSSLVQ